MRHVLWICICYESLIKNNKKKYLYQIRTILYLPNDSDLEYSLYLYIYMEKDSPSKTFAKDLLKTIRLECLESNLNLEQLGKMNEVVTEKYSELVKDTSEIEENFSSILDEYELNSSIIDQLKTFKGVIDQIENSLDLLEEMTLRLESKITIQ